MKRLTKDSDVSFADVAEDAIGCFFLVLGEQPGLEALWKAWDDVQRDPKLAAELEQCLEDAKNQVVEDCTGFKIVKE
jgi:hypothetical protein